jgi:chromosome segregation ATPase
MEPEASRAAISAIAALQQRVRDLEDQGALLEEERDSLHRRLEVRDSAFRVRESSLNEATSKARQILDTTSAAMTHLHEERTRRQRLRSQLQEQQHLLDATVSKQRSHRAAHRKSKGEVSALLRILREYEMLLGDLISPGLQRGALTQDEAILILAGNYEANSLPPNLARILRQLQEAPKRFARQSIENKRVVVKALSEGSAAITELNTRIKQLETQKFSSSTPKKFQADVKRISAQLLILSNEMSKFEFG